MNHIRIPLVSYPTLCDLLNLLSTNENDLNNIWADNRFSRLFPRSSWALAYIVKLAITLNSKKDFAIYVPDYFCNVTLTPLRQLSVKIIFYPVTDKLQPNWYELDKLVKQNNPGIFLLSHYFGFESQTEIAKIFCKRNNCLFVEDCAHVLKPYGGIGKNSAATFFSFHKLISIPEGSILTLNTDSFCDILNISQNVLNERLLKKDGLKNNKKEVLIWFVKRIIQRFLFANKIGCIIQNYPNYDDSINFVPKSILNEYNLGSISLKMLSYYSSKIDSISNIRRGNYDYYQKLIKKYQLEDFLAPLFSKKPENFVPYYFPLRVLNSSISSKIYNCFWNSGIAVSSWPDLPNEVKNDPKYHSIAIQLRQQIILLPVHQSITKYHLSYIDHFFQNKLCQMLKS